MKCGTTSLHYYLDLHPQIRMSRPKELNFFIADKNWRRGLDWYRRQFRGNALVHGESSPNYTYAVRYPGIPERMHQVVPDARLIYMVRDPIERMISHYIHHVWDGRETNPAEQALRPRPGAYLDRSRYYTQLSLFLVYYPLTRVLVLDMADLMDRRRETLRRVLEFLDVDTRFASLRTARLLHRSRRKRRKTKAGRRIERSAPGRLLHRLPAGWRWPFEELLYLPFSRKIERPTLSSTLRREIALALGDEVEALRTLTGQRFDTWSL